MLKIDYKKWKFIQHKYKIKDLDIKNNLLRHFLILNITIEE